MNVPSAQPKANGLGGQTTQKKEHKPWSWTVLSLRVDIVPILCLISIKLSRLSDLQIPHQHIWGNNMDGLILFTFVHLSCYNKTAQTEWLTNNENLFLTVLEARSPRSRCCQIQCLVRACFLIVGLLSHCNFT